MEMRCYRRLLDISYKEHITNQEVRGRIKNAIGPPVDLLSIVRQRKLKLKCCFEKDRRVASIKLLVVDQRNQDIKHYISYAGLVLVVIGSIYFVFCICCKKPQLNAR
ncbi:hypothetical protein ElyMa_003279100 [Elysia marginata]|uniref:Uncharacterized protein n=1 Tax=Elysia marginata TaxID=1093978 RepID=A0AAV4JER8_9GAST|nr:hypothetical protein ElyMa_003279100 [Elysia marginata]